MHTEQIEPGCYVDGHWGQYGPARVVQIATELGFDGDVDDLAARHLAECAMVQIADPLTEDEFEALGWAADEAEIWLNEHVAAEGFSFGWHDGEFFYQSNEWWEEG